MHPPPSPVSPTSSPSSRGSGSAASPTGLFLSSTCVDLHPSLPRIQKGIIQTLLPAQQGQLFVSFAIAAAASATTTYSMVYPYKEASLYSYQSNPCSVRSNPLAYPACRCRTLGLQLKT